MENIARINILNAIFSDLCGIIQWFPNNVENSAKYMFKAESLIEILEVEDCGSVGGFDRKSPVKRDTNFNLFNRYLAVVRRYNDEDNIKTQENFDLNDMKLWFNALTNLKGESVDVKEIFQSFYFFVAQEKPTMVNHGDTITIHELERLMSEFINRKS